MLKQEFEKIAGIHVSTDTYYNVIEPMYMATDLNKHEFIKGLNLKQYAIPEKMDFWKQLKRHMNTDKKICGVRDDNEIRNNIEKICDEYVKIFDMNGYYFDTEYEMPTYNRGCTFIYRIVFYKGTFEEKIEINKKR